MIHSLVFVLDAIAFILFLLTFIKQIGLQIEYKNLNGLRYHRLGYMFITGSILLMIATEIWSNFDKINGYGVFETLELKPLIFIFIEKVLIVVSALFSYLWFKNSKFKFLKIFDRWI